MADTDSVADGVANADAGAGLPLEDAAAVATGACAAVVLLEAHPAVSATADIAAAKLSRIRRMGFPSR
ncbi:hypothetical protein [Streptacidiphilus sp. PAMC 29251]